MEELAKMLIESAKELAKGDSDEILAAAKVFEILAQCNVDGWMWQTEK